MTISLTAAWDRAYAGEWLPITFDLKRTSDDPRPLKLNNIRCEDPDLTLDTDLFQHNLEIGAGESYRCTVPIKVQHPKVVDLKSIMFVFVDPTTQPERQIRARISAKKLIVKPALGQEIEVTLKSIFQYEGAAKCLLTLQHRGGTPFTDVTVTLSPSTAIKAGKPVFNLPTFNPGDRQQLDVVAGGQDLEIIISATSEGQRAEVRHTRSLDAPATKKGKAFRFLEPTRLAKDSIRIFRAGNNDKLQAEQRRETFVLENGNKYRIEILPRQPDVQSVKLNELLPVLKTERQGQSWIFTVEVNLALQLRRRENIYYEVDTPTGKLTGEIPVCLMPSRWRYLQTAGYLGFATTLQGMTALGKALSDSSYNPVELISEIDFGKEYPLLFLFSIPVFYLAYRATDWLLYQISNI